MGYLTTCLGLIATCVAIRGETWNPNAVSWRRLTIVGWAALSIALASAGLEGYKVHTERSSHDLRRHAAEATFRNLVQQPKSELALESFFSANPDVPAGSTSLAISIKRRFDQLAIEYDQALIAYRDVLNPSETTAILNVSSLLRTADADDNYSGWWFLGKTLDGNLDALEHSFCNLPHDRSSFCANFGKISTMMVQLFPASQN